MNKHSQTVLEFPLVLKWISSFAKSHSGQEAVQNLRPIKGRLARERKLFESFSQIWDLAAGQVPEASFQLPDLQLLAPIDSWLGPDELIEIRNFMEISGKVRSFLNRETFKKTESIAPLLERLDSFQESRDAFKATFDDKDLIRDDASAELLEIRPLIRNCEKAIRNKLDHILRNDSNDLYQEKYVTMRKERFCLPLRRDCKSKVRGIVHDESATGQTVFIEPDSIISLGNERSGMLRREKQILIKIIKKLCEKLRQEIPLMESSFEVLTTYDCARAVTVWSREIKCQFAQVGETYNLKQARHPLMYKSFAEQKNLDQLIPLNMRLGKDLTTLAITGSNTGGKTIILKTVGLLTLMNQCGLPIPADENSTLPLFDNVLADIGDEQSIAQNLSTFSAHLKSISEILGAAQKNRCLILLDELGSGTDPLEGGALGNAILHQLAQYNSLTLLTTHIGGIKVFTQAQTGMLNAAVRFNRKDLHPEYILDIGIPGASHAIEIAQTQGIPEAITTKARSFLSDKELKLENVLNKLQEQQVSMERDVKQAKRSRDVAVREKEALQNELKKLRKERKEILQESQKEAERIVEKTRKEMETAIRRLKKSDEFDKEIKAVREKVITKRDNLRNAIERNRPKPEAPVKKEALKEGDKVWVERLKTHAKILKINKGGKQILLDMDGMQVSVKPNELGTAESVKEKHIAKPKQGKIQYRAQRAVSMEIKLIGMRVDAAMRELEPWLSSAYGSSMEQVKIIHGKGSGQLRAAIHDFLSKQRYIERYYCPSLQMDPAGDSVTWVEFRQ